MCAWLQVTDFDVAVKAQEGPVACSSVVTSFPHMAPEMIADKQVTKVGSPPCLRMRTPATVLSSLIMHTA